MPERLHHDLSSDQVKLDYHALRLTAEIAYRESRDRIAHYLDALHWRDCRGEHIGRTHDARSLAGTARDLAIAAETYSTLVEGETRSIKILVNVPEINVRLEPVES